MAKLTIKEIAKLANVSPSAVSIVLNNRKGVSEETRGKILEIIEKLQYTPNPNSRRLLFNKTNNIAVLFRKNTSPLEHFFYSDLNRIILHECEALGYNLIFTSVNIEDGNVVLPNVIRAYDADGVIFYGDADSLLLNAIRKYDIPYVIVDSHVLSNDSLSVNADYMKAAYLAADHLVQLGHLDIAYVGSSFTSNFGGQTFAGFKKAVGEHSMVIPIQWIQVDAVDEASAYLSMKEILSSGKHPSAVLCAADIFAVGVIKCIKDHGLKIPEDISVVGIDDILLARYLEPPLTTIRIDREEMGRLAIELLMKKINHEAAESKLLSSYELAQRSSTRKYR